MPSAPFLTVARGRALRLLRLLLLLLSR